MALNGIVSNGDDNHLRETWVAWDAMPDWVRKALTYVTFTVVFCQQNDLVRHTYTSIPSLFLGARVRPNPVPCATACTSDEKKTQPPSIHPVFRVILSTK